MRNPYQHHRKPQDIYRVFEVTVLDDPVQREKVLDLMRREVPQVETDNQYGVKSAWHLDLRQGPYLAWGCDVVPAAQETYLSQMTLMTRDYPDPRARPAVAAYQMPRGERGSLYGSAMMQLLTFAERRAPSLQRDPAKEPNRTPEPEYEPGD